MNNSFHSTLNLKDNTEKDSNNNTDKNNNYSKENKSNLCKSAMKTNDDFDADNNYYQRRDNENNFLQMLNTEFYYYRSNTITKKANRPFF